MTRRAIDRSVLDISTISAVPHDSTNLELSESTYDLSGQIYGVHSALRIHSNCRSRIICAALVILSNDVTLSGLEIEGSVIANRVMNLRIEDCKTGAIVLTRAARTVLSGLRICGIDAAAKSGIQVQERSSVHMSGCEVANTGMRPVLAIASSSQAMVEDCSFGDECSKGICVLDNSALEICRSEIRGAIGGMEVRHSRVIARNCGFTDISKDPAISLGRCPSAVVCNCSFERIKRSAIAVTYGSRAVITGNRFSSLSGNSVYASDGSSVDIRENVAKKGENAAFASLEQSTGTICQNEIAEMDRAAVSVRGAVAALINGNDIMGIWVGEMRDPPRSNPKICPGSSLVGMLSQTVGNANLWHTLGE
jgi:hypothetical protein